MKFLNPELSYIIIIISLVFLGLIIWSFFRWKSLIKFLGDSQIFLNYSLWKIIVKNFLWVVAILSLCLVLMRPYKGERKIEVENLSRDILIVLDLSNSMNVKDMKGLSRLSYAKWWIREFVKNHRNDRVGLFSFAGATFKEVPIGHNHNFLIEKLGKLGTDLLYGGTNIEKALANSIKVIEEISSQYASIVLLTDGEEIRGKFQESLEKLKKLSIPVFTIGLGNPHSEGVVLDAKGQVQKSDEDFVMSKSNQQVLSKIASETGGLYIPYKSDIIGLGGLELVDEALKKVDARILKDKDLTFKNEKPTVFLLVSIVSLLLYLLIGNRRKS